MTNKTKMIILLTITVISGYTLATIMFFDGYFGMFTFLTMTTTALMIIGARLVKEIRE